MQVRRTRPGAAKNELVLLYHWSNPLELLWYKKRTFTVGIVLNTYEKNSITYYDIKGLYTAKLVKRNGLYRGIHVKRLSGSTANEEYIVDRLRKKAQQFVFLIDIPESDKLIYLMTFISKLSELTDFVSHYFITPLADRKRLYNETDIMKRAELLTAKLDIMINDVQKKKGMAGS